jgi:ADP-ribosyl-[dinitrogen reductase] hydrolase
VSGALIASMADRALGTLVGLAVGDAVGTTLEFRVRDSYVLLTDMVGGPFRMPPGGWTDDTAMALGLADSLVALGRFDGADIMRRWLRWMEKGAYNHTGSCFDIGNQTAAASVGGGARNTAEAGSHNQHLSRDAKAAGGCVLPATDAPPSPARSR